MQRRQAKRFLVGVTASILAVAGTEIAFRSVLWVQGRPYSAEEAEAAIRTAVDMSSAYTPRGAGEKVSLGDAERNHANRLKRSNVLHPFTGSEREHDTGGVLEAFRAGIPEGAFVIVVIGGSVASSYVSANEGEDGTHQLASLLSSKYPQVVVLNYAHAAYKEPQQLMRLAYLFSLGYKPDLVLNIDGYNDLAAAAGNANKGINPAYPSPATWGLWLNVKDDRETVLKRARLIELADQKEALASRTFRFGLQNSSVYGAWIMSRLARINREGVSLQKGLGEPDPSDIVSLRQAKGPPFVDTQEEVLRLIMEVWFESSVSIQGMCSVRGVDYLHVLQPALNDELSKPPSVDEVELQGNEERRDYTRIGYNMLRERGQMLRDKGVKFLDASLVFSGVEETLFTDPVHFNGEGMRLFAGLVGGWVASEALDGQ